MKFSPLVLLLAVLPAGTASAQAPGGMTVKEEGVALRTGCTEDAPVVARLQQGEPVRVRFALSSGGRRCFAVTAAPGGQRLQGYVSADALTGVEEFEQSRKQASSAALPRISRSRVAEIRDKATPKDAASGRPDYALTAQLYQAADALEKGRPEEAEQILARSGAPRSHQEVALVRAAALLALNQPDRALDVLEPALREHQRDHELLAMAGLAAHRMDDSHSAVSYWKRSLDLRDDPEVRQMLAKVEHELSTDRSVQRSYGSRFLLRYEDEIADPEVARQMVQALEAEFSRISLSLGCRADSRIVAIVQNREAYRLTTGAAEWSGGQYDGRIRIPMASGVRGVDPMTRRVFAHEIVHACLSSLGRWPAWLHEGLAQKLSGEALNAGQVKVLRQMALEGSLPKLSELPPSWSHFDAGQAALCYALALVATDLFFQKYGTTGPRNLLNNPETLPQVAESLDKALLEALAAGPR